MLKKENIDSSFSTVLPFSDMLTLRNIRSEFYNFFSLHGCHRFYPKRSNIFQLYDVAYEGYVVESGRVKTYKLTSDGKEVIFNIVNPGEILGLAEVLLNCPRMRYAETLCETTLCVMSKEQLFKKFYSNNDYCLKNLWILTQQLLRYQHIVEDLAVLPVRDRVIKLLVRLCKELGIQKENYTIIDFPVTHEEIAQMVGSTRQTVTLILNELRKKGILDWKQKKIKILRWMDLIDQT